MILLSLAKSLKFLNMSNQKNKSIGIFDSGIGGLSVLKEIKKILPKENVIYFGDTKRMPYGNKSKNAITFFSKNICEFLLKQNTKIILSACSTATALALDFLNKQYNTPIIGMIDPVLEIIKTEKPKKIAILATKATIKSQIFEKKIKKINPNIKIFSIAAPLLAYLVEENLISHTLTTQHIKEYLKPIINIDIDYLILACTHYPLIKKQIRKLTPPNIKIVDPSIQRAIILKHHLQKNNLLNNQNKSPKYHFYVSDDIQNFKDSAKRILDFDIIKIKKLSIF